MQERKKKSTTIKKVANKGPLGERVYNELKKAILEGLFAPGELLPEDFLTEVTGASRTPVREALMHLHGDGLVKIIPRKGARILEMSSDELNELVEARVLLETAFFDRAMEKISLKKINKIKCDMDKIIAEMESIEHSSPLWIDKRLEYSKLDFEFHRSLVESCNNRFLLNIYDTLLDRIIVYSHHTVIKIPEFFLKSAKEHDNILTALLDGEYKKAKELLKMHIHTLDHRLTK